jgi:hypothetical protein
MADGDSNQPMSEVPNIQGVPDNIDMGSGSGVAQAANLGIRQQAATDQQNQVPKLGAPILATFLKQMIQGPGPGTIQPGQSQPMRPPSRLDAFEGFLGNFLQSFATGMGAAGHGPGANERGAAAAMMAPYQQQLQQYQLGQAQQAQQAQMQREQAQTQLAQAQAEQYGKTVMTPLGPMNEKLAEKMYPAYVSAQGRETAATTEAGAKVQAAQIGQGMMVDVPPDLQKQFSTPAKLPLKQLNQLESAANKPLTTIQGATDAYLLNKQTMQKTALGIGSGRIAATMARPVQVADPNTPGGVKYVPAGEAMRQGMQAPASSTVKVPAAVQKDFTSGQSAKTLNSFNTATDHLRILSQLGDALQNGSTPLINRFGNQWATATGGAAPTTFNMAKQAVAGEVAKTFKGQATEGEIAAINSVINDAQSPQQLKGAIGTALTLMESKREALMKQYDQGIKGQAAFPGNKGKPIQFYEINR